MWRALLVGLLALAGWLALSQPATPLALSRAAIGVAPAVPTAAPPTHAPIVAAPTAPAGPAERAATAVRQPEWPLAERVASTPTPQPTTLPRSGCPSARAATPSVAVSGVRSTTGDAAPATEALPLQWHQPVALAIQRALALVADDYAVVAKRLDDGCGATLNDERVFYAASLFKLAILFELFYQRERGQVRFDEHLTLIEKYEQYALGELLWPRDSAVRIDELAEKMITHSDNVAAMLLHDRLGNSAINERMRELGLRATKITNDLPTTAADMARLLEAIASGRIVGPAASAEMLALLRAQRVNDRIPAGLPRGVAVAHKTGNWERACHDAGIVFAPAGAYILVVLSEEVACAKRVASLSTAVYEALAADRPADTARR